MGWGQVEGGLGEVVVGVENGLVGCQVWWTFEFGLSRHHVRHYLAQLLVFQNIYTSKRLGIDERQILALVLFFFKVGDYAKQYNQEYAYQDRNKKQGPMKGLGLLKESGDSISPGSCVVGECKFI